MIWSALHGDMQLPYGAGGDLRTPLNIMSADIFLGVPYNITSYGLFLEMLGWVTGRKTRELVIAFGDLHLYNNHVEQATTQLSRTPHKLPTLQLKVPLPGATAMEQLLAVRYEHLNLRGYTHHPPITADVAV